jgi:hypothetical protein
MPWFSSATAGIRFCSDLALGFVASLGLCLVARRLSGLWKASLVAFFAFALMSAFSSEVQLMPEVVQSVGLLCWGLLCMNQVGRAPGVPLRSSTLTGREDFPQPQQTGDVPTPGSIREPASRLCHAVVIAIFVGLAVYTALGKFSFVFAAVLSVGAVGCGLALLGSWRLGCGAVLGFGAGWLLVWVLLGQRLSGLGPFLSNSWAIVSGYEQAMVIKSVRSMVGGASLAAILAAASVALRGFCGFGVLETKARLFRTVNMVWLLGLLLLSWKHAIVRG